MARVRSIAEIVLSTNDLPGLERFYGEVLGFHRFSSGGGDPPTIVFLKIADLDTPLGIGHPQVLVLTDPARHTFGTARHPSPTHERSTLHHLAFEIDTGDYDAEFERLAGLGLEPVQAVFAGLRAKSIFFKDPDGNQLELIAHDPDTGA